VETRVERPEGAPDLVVLSLEGELDASNFEEVIETGRSLYAGGTRRLVLDLSGLSYMGSSGLVALHSLAVLLRGEEPPDPEYGWSAFHSIGQASGDGTAQNAVKVAGPQPQVDRVLDRTGLKRFFEVYPDRAAALASF
jgi:anti-anti-sigma regulatory factor